MNVLYLTMIMIEFTSHALTQLVPTIDSDTTIRRIHIKLTTTSVHKLIDYNQLGNEIDHFLLTRPWWYVSRSLMNGMSILIRIT